MRRIWKCLLGIGLILPLAGCQNEAIHNPPISSGDLPVSIVIATDLHDLSPSLTDGGELFQQVIRSGDGKAMEYIQEITSAFTCEVIQAKPDILILSGDLTFNGARASHTDLIEKLEQIQNAGIQVLVIPGNHDLNNPNAASFSGDSFQRQPSMTAREFRQAYAEFGFDQAVSQDSDSFSYVYAVRSDLWVLMVDVNSAQENEVPKSTLRWIKKQLEQAQDQGVQVIAVSHQNLLVHNPLFVSGYQIGNADELRQLYEQYGVLCNLSGHMHLQHIASNGVTEIATSALSLSPNQYGLIQYDGKALNYQTKRLDVSAWAAERGLENKDLLNFEEYAREFFMETAHRQVTEELNWNDLSQTEMTLLTDTFTQLNYAYFSGNSIDILALEEGLKLWAIQPLSFYSGYIQSILADADLDYHRTTLQLVRS